MDKSDNGHVEEDDPAATRGGHPLRIPIQIRHEDSHGGVGPVGGNFAAISGTETAAMLLPAVTQVREAARRSSDDDPNPTENSFFFRGMSDGDGSTRATDDVIVDGRIITAETIDEPFAGHLFADDSTSGDDQNDIDLFVGGLAEKPERSHTAHSLADRPGTETAPLMATDWEFPNNRSDTPNPMQPASIGELADDGGSAAFWEDNTHYLYGDATSEVFFDVYSRYDTHIEAGNGNDLIYAWTDLSNQIDVWTDFFDGGAHSDTVSYIFSTSDVTVDLDFGTDFHGNAVGRGWLQGTEGAHDGPTVFGSYYDILKSIENATGSNYDDLLYGSTVDNVLTGLSGDDYLSGYEGDDTLLGGDGNDVASGGDGDDTIEGGDGDDALYGGNGEDTISGGDGDDYIIGGAGDDYLYGNAGFNEILGGGGDDVILLGEAGTATGGSGNDTVIGGNGDDVLAGGSGNDHVSGLGGDDLIQASTGVNWLDGGTGEDTVQFLGNWDVEVLLYASGDGHAVNYSQSNFLTSIEHVITGGGDDTVVGNWKANQITTGVGDDNVEGGGGHDEIWAGDGEDHVLGGSGHDEIWAGAGNDYVSAGNGDDIVHGDEGDDTVYAGSGDDSIFGGDGDDFLQGQSGEDLINAGAGHDRIRGGSDADVMFGGADRDDFIWNTGDINAIDTIYFFTLGEDRIEIAPNLLQDAPAPGESYVGQVVAGSTDMGASTMLMAKLNAGWTPFAELIGVSQAEAAAAIVDGTLFNGSVVVGPVGGGPGGVIPQGLGGTDHDTLNGSPVAALQATALSVGQDGVSRVDYDDDGDLDLYTINSPGGDNGLLVRGAPGDLAAADTSSRTGLLLDAIQKPLETADGSFGRADTFVFEPSSELNGPALHRATLYMDVRYDNSAAVAEDIVRADWPEPDANTIPIGDGCAMLDSGALDCLL